MTRKPTRKRDLPTGDYLEHGFGCAPVHRNLREIRRMGLSIVLDALDGTSRSLTATPVVNAFGTAAEVFRIAGGESASDWFTVHKLLGQPSSALCLEIGDFLSDAGQRLAAGDERAARSVFEDLHDRAVPDMIENYLNTTNHQKAASHSEADGWAYILWSSAEPDAVIAAVTELTVDEAISGRGKRGHPLGVLAAWQVYRPEEVTRKVADLLSGLCLDADIHVVERGLNGTATLGMIKDTIEQMLVADDLLVPSPWHFDIGLEAVASSTAGGNSPSP
jgi:hypothetical protein